MHIKFLVLFLMYVLEVSAIDEIAAVHRDLECLYEELSGEQQPPAQVSAIAQKVAKCRDRCYSAFSLLGKEKKAYESKIESLQKTPGEVDNNYSSCRILHRKTSRQSGWA